MLDSEVRKIALEEIGGIEMVLRHPKDFHILKIQIQNDKKGKCEICHRDTYIIKHHTRYFPEEIISVCVPCHIKIHYLTQRNKIYPDGDPRNEIKKFKPPIGEASYFYRGIKWIE